MQVRLLVALISISSFSISQTILLDENFGSGLPATWTVYDGDGLVPAPAVDSFTQAWITFQNNDDSCVASTSYYDPAGQSADYLITPKLSLGLFSKLVWSARSYDASYPDDYVVLISTTDSLATSFTDTLYVQSEESFYWISRSVQLDLEGYASQNVYIAFKNITTDGYILMLDDVLVHTSNFASTEDITAPVISVYPNPTANFIQVSDWQQGDVFRIYSPDGRQVISTADRVADVTRLASGTYYYSVLRDSQPLCSGTFVKL